MFLRLTIRSRFTAHWPCRERYKQTYRSPSTLRSRLDADRCERQVSEKQNEHDVPRIGPTWAWPIDLRKCFTETENPIVEMLIDDIQPA